MGLVVVPSQCSKLVEGCAIGGINLESLEIIAVGNFKMRTTREKFNQISWEISETNETAMGRLSDPKAKAVQVRMFELD